MKTRFDCIVIGAGHAGIEAANIAAKAGADTALVTINKDNIAAMSCNPAIGGMAKGQIVREVDAMGGVMAKAIDATGLQFRILNQSKGPAVQSPRAQADKYEYVKWMTSYLEEVENLTIIEAMAEDIIVKEGGARGVICKDGRRLESKTVIVTTGTFLRGVMHIGLEQFEGGRMGELPSVRLSMSLQRLGFKAGRLKTGTPVRLDGATVDVDRLEMQPGDAIPKPFSFLNDSITQEQIPCWMTYTNEKMHALLKDNLDKAPLYSGQIVSTGPRYCPSIESKIIRFADKKRHLVHLEPEDRAMTTIYCNGISTSYPRDIQRQMIKMMQGTENAKIVKYAYAIEYDYFAPSQLTRSLETKLVDGLFFAGQINGTSGYEEAAGQGLVAGINAVLKMNNKEPLVLARDQAYIGVLIDDLLTREIDEPYRMFTSRAEYRLLLRSDNADRRLTEIAHKVGVISGRRWQKYCDKMKNIKKLKKFLKTNKKNGVSLWKYLERPNNELAGKIADYEFVKEHEINSEQIEAAVIDAKYGGYLVKQQRLVESFKTLDNQRIPQEIDYKKVEHLRSEAFEKLTSFNPETLGQASRISGITPADIMVLQVHFKKYKYKS